jgi:hypothetical protein
MIHTPLDWLPRFGPGAPVLVNKNDLSPLGLGDLISATAIRNTLLDGLPDETDDAV